MPLFGRGDDRRERSAADREAARLERERRRAEREGRPLPEEPAEPTLGDGARAPDEPLPDEPPLRDEPPAPTSRRSRRAVAARSRPPPDEAPPDARR